MTTPRSRSEEQSNDDGQTVSTIPSTSSPHPTIERSTSITDESDFAIYLPHSTLVDEGAQSHDFQSSLPPRQNTTSPDDPTPEAEQSPLLSEHPSDDELPTNEAHCFPHLASVSVDIEGHASGETLRSREEPFPDDTTSQSSSVPVRNRQNLEWIPYTLRWQSLTILVISTVILLSLVVALWWRSVVNNGLGTDDGSSMLLFGWRFTPPLLAVLYVQMTAMLLDDVRRTECFARMARPGGASAASSILRAPGAWWNALADGLSKHGGHRSWLLFSTACLNVIGFLAISPLSSSFLELEEVMVTTDVDFTRMTTQKRISPVSNRETKLQTMGHLLHNISTSVWISDNYTILPFWPSNLAISALGSELPGPFQTWQADTWVLSTELDCSPLSLIERVNAAYGPGMRLTFSNNKCHYEIKDPKTPTALWYSRSILYDDFQQWGKCEETDMIFIVPDSDGSQSTGHACFSKYFMAEITVTIDVSNPNSDAAFDEKNYLQKRQPMPRSFLDAEEVQSISLTEDWSNYVYLDEHIWQEFCQGLCALLTAAYNFNIMAMADDDAVISRAEKVKQQFFAEILQYSLQTQGASKESVAGKATKIESRVDVAAGVAVALASFLGISLFLQLVVWLLSRSRARFLNLKKDPATATGIAALIDLRSQTHTSLRMLKHDSQTPSHSILGKKHYYTTYNKLHEVDSAAGIPEVGGDVNLTTSDWRPLVLRSRTLTALGLLIITLLIAVLVLYDFARRSSLYRTAFVYQAKISMFGVHTLSPFSLIPTLLAVVVGLWWSSVDATFRRLQPYLSMAKAPQPFSYGAGLSYQSSYWVWATFKAASKQHWLLLLVTGGASLSPILTISMSALLKRNETSISTYHQASRDLELRTMPSLLDESVLDYSMSWYENLTSIIFDDFHTNISTDWLYSATIQLTINGSEPSWSRDGWSFTPVDIAQFSNRNQNMDPSSPDWSTNVSITTPAIRGRLKCSPYENLSDTSEWLTPQNLRNISVWDNSTIPHAIESAYQPGGYGHEKVSPGWPYFFNTSYLTDGGIPKCCTNGSSWPPSASVLGRWSVSDNPHGDLRPPFNLTIKWIYGRMVTGLKPTGVNEEYMMFIEIPSAQALDCTPIIETSSAWVTVDQRSGSVKDFSILEEPKEASEPWAHNFIVHGPEKIDPTKGFPFHITVSYGILFLLSLLDAGSLGVFNIDKGSPDAVPDNKAFTFRNEEQGLNLDAMTYAMYALAGKDPKALLDAGTMEATAQKTFTTFFQHFVSSGVSSNASLNKASNWAYQPINATLPSCLAWNDTTQTCMEQPYVWPVSHTNRTVEAQVLTRVTLLQMNAVAVWLSVGILAWLIATTVVVAAAMNRHLRGLKGDVERVADVLLLVAGSDKLLGLLKERSERELAEEGVMTRLGWFEDRDGQLRWGIEVVEGESDSGDD